MNPLGNWNTFDGTRRATANEILRDVVFLVLFVGFLLALRWFLL